jgi:four helix bundle protein
MKLIRSHKELEVYKLAYKMAMAIYKLSKSFPGEERYSLTDQIRRSSRSVAANLAEAFRKRRYEKAFVAKLSDSEGEAAETQTWLDFSRDCGYINSELCDRLNSEYEHVIGMLVNMIKSPENGPFKHPLQFTVSPPLPLMQ